MRKGARRNFCGISLKSQRLDKRYPKRTQFAIMQDLGSKYKITEYSSPYLEASEQTFDKSKSGNYLDLYDRNGLMIRKSLTTEKIYVYRMRQVGEHRKGEYICELENHDLWNLGIACLRAVQAFREEINRVIRGKVFRKMYLSLSKAPSDLFRRG
jgi:hypothetical protein